jgi:hypothetical protein
MKQKHNTFDSFKSMPSNSLALITGGNNENEYITIIINGVPYRVKINKNGEYISLPEPI